MANADNAKSPRSSSTHFTLTYSVQDTSLSENAISGEGNINEHTRSATSSTFLSPLVLIDIFSCNSLRNSLSPVNLGPSNLAS